MRDGFFMRALAPRVALAAVLVLVSCQRQAPPPTAPTPVAAAPRPSSTDPLSLFDPKLNPGAAVGTFVDIRTLTATERKFGIAPKRDPRVTYASDVIVMEHGDEAIRDAASDGMTWTFDATAPQVSEFQEGKIVFATGRAVGRIGQLTRQGDIVTVKFAPVQITDVIDTGHFIIDGDFNAMNSLIYEAPDFPAVVDLNADAAQHADWRGDGDAGLEQGGAFIRTQGLASGLGAEQPLDLAPIKIDTQAAPITLNGGMTMVPLVGSDSSVGLDFSYAKDGLHIDAAGKLVLREAHIRFELDILHKGIISFGMALGGATSLVLELKSWTNEKQRFVNVSEFGQLPTDITLPVPVAGVPLALTFKTTFVFKSAFSASTSVLTARGEYGMRGEVFIGFKDGSPIFIPFAATYAVSPLASNVTGVSVGINSMETGFSIRPMIGIGAFGFNTGVYVGVDFKGSVTKQSNIGMSHCRAGFMNAGIDSGVGYQLPGPLVKFINTVLSVFTHYRIEETGTIIPGGKGDFMHLPMDIPAGCAGLAQSGAQS